MKKNKFKILFVCKSNMFRSRISEAYFKKINKNNNVAASSAGLVKGDYPLHQNQVKTLKEFGININGKPRGVSWDLIRKSDLVIITADDVPANLFYIEDFQKKIKVWKIKDAMPYNRKEIIRVKNELTKKIEKLIKDLEDK